MRVYYRYSYKGLEKVPYGKPVVLAPNHTNAFIDPVVIGIVVRQKVRFFARGDVFKGGFAKWILNQLNISPMYRIQEGYAELKKNDRTFEECRNLLAANKTILLFPEAICIQERRLRPLKKGLARIVFQSAEAIDFNKDILVVPVGLNYSDAKRFRSKLFIDFGDPVSVKEYEQQFKQDKVKAINEFTKMFEEKMAEHLVIIKNKENDNLVAGIEEIYLYEWIKSKNEDVNDLECQYWSSREISKMINVLTTNNHQDIISSLNQKIGPYTQQLKKYDLRDHLLRTESINKMNVLNFLGEYIIIYFGMIIYGIALLFNFLPFYISKKYTQKKVKNIEFFASIYANMSMILWLIFFMIQLVCVALIFRDWTLLGIYALLIPLSGRFILRFYPIMKKIFGRWRLLRLVRKEKNIVQELISTRAKIVQEIIHAKEIYASLLK